MGLSGRGENVKIILHIKVWMVLECLMKVELRRDKEDGL